MISQTYPTNLPCPEVSVKSFIARRKDRVVSRVQPHAVVPRRTSPFGARCIHVAHEIGIVGNEQIRPYATRRTYNKTRSARGRKSLAAVAAVKRTSNE